MARSLHCLLLAVSVALVGVSGAGCASKPTMRLNHAEVTGVQIAFPPSLAVVMTVVVDVYNPNSYDVAIRAVRGQLFLANRYSMPVDFRANQDGIWLRSDAWTRIGVPVVVPAQLALAVVRESYTQLMIPYRFAGRADVTATRTFRLEKDDYSVDEMGFISRQQIEAAIPRF
jgi:hypothetical protein